MSYGRMMMEIRFRRQNVCSFDTRFPHFSEKTLACLSHSERGLMDRG